MKHGRQTRDIRWTGIFRAMLMLAAAETAAAQTAQLETSSPSPHGDRPPLHYDAEVNLQSPEMEEREEIRTQLLALARARDFAALEALFAKARESQAVMADGLQVLDFYYRAMPEIVGALPSMDEARIDGFFESWREAFPQSPTPLTARGGMEIRTAWAWRGGGWASAVTEEGWEGFRKHLARAKVHLTEASELETQDPQTYASLITVVMGQGGPRELTLKSYERGFALDPDYASLCAAVTRQLLPRWGGQPGELVAFADRTADRLGGEEGDALYARFGRLAYNYDGSYGFASYHSFDWNRIVRGFVALRKQFPLCAAKYFAQEAELAAALGKKEAFRQASANLGDQWRAYYLGDANSENVEAEYLALEPKLLEAANLGDHKGITHLLAAGADINARNENGQTALNLAVQNDDSAMVDVLLAGGADPNIPDTKGWTVLAIATSDNQPHLIRRLLEGGAHPNESMDERLPPPLLLAVSLERPETIKLLLELGADPNVPDAKGWTALSLATQMNQPQLIRTLVEGGANTDSPLELRAPLLLAIEQAHPEIVKLLLELGADPDLDVPRVGTPLLYAIRSNQADCVRELLEGKADPNLPDAAGWTPLGTATHSDRRDLIEDLVRHGARTDEPLGLRAPLMIAIEQSRPELIGRLIELGADPDLHVPRIGTPLHHAIRKNQADCVRALLEGGADPNAVILQENGVQILPTPLKLAQDRGTPELIDLFEKFAE